MSLLENVLVVAIETTCSFFPSVGTVCRSESSLGMGWRRALAVVCEICLWSKVMTCRTVTWQTCCQRVQDPAASVMQVSGYPWQPPWTSGSCAFRVPSLGLFGLLLLGFLIFAGWGDPRGSVYRLPNITVVIYHYLAICLSCFLSSFCLYELYSSLGDYLSLVLDNKPVHNSVWNFLRLWALRTRRFQSSTDVPCDVAAVGDLSEGLVYLRKFTDLEK